MFFHYFFLLYLGDNKYQALPPYGQNGVISLTEDDLLGSRPLMLTSGWLLSDERAVNVPVDIGGFSSFQDGCWDAKPHGSAVYRLILRYSGSPAQAAMSFPQLFSRHRILLDGQVLSQGRGGANISFPLTAGDHLLTVETDSEPGFSSGMYHTPMLANTQVLFTTVLIQCTAYGFAFFSSLTLALFTSTHWRSAGSKTTFWFGLLCCAFSLYLSYYFVQLFALPFLNLWYWVQSASRCLLCYCVIRLTALVCSMEDSKITTGAQRILLLASLVLLLAELSIPAFPKAAWLCGILTDLYHILTFCTLLFLPLHSKSKSEKEYHFTLLGCISFGVGLLLSLVSPALFEPIFFFWQFEWCGLFLVLLFGFMMAARNKRILTENQRLSNHLEQLVSQRTAELTQLLLERKAFFADMAHDLKAPIFATKGFIQAIRDNNTYVDKELLCYLNQVEQQQQSLAQRVQSLTLFNQLEAVTETWELVSVGGFLKEVCHAHHMAAEVLSVHLVVLPMERDGRIMTQKRKLHILLENLIFNALHATPATGSITLSAELDQEECHLIVADTGSGIPIEELPYIFRRFYVGKLNRGTGSGLGLYIVKRIVEEFNGEITVSSKPNQGTVFYIDLPLTRT